MPTSTVSGLLEFSTCYNFISSRQVTDLIASEIGKKNYDECSHILACMSKVGLPCDVYSLAQLAELNLASIGNVEKWLPMSQY